MEDVTETEILDMGFDYMISPEQALPGYARLMPCQEPSICSSSQQQPQQNMQAVTLHLMTCSGRCLRIGRLSDKGHDVVQVPVYHQPAGLRRNEAVIELEGSVAEGPLRATAPACDHLAGAQALCP